MHLRFYHKGKFQNSRYVGGEETAVMFVDLDRFSYTVLMEHVKDDLKYTEIGGIYVSKGDMEGWKLCADDADLNELVKAAKAAKVGEYLDFYIDNVVDFKIKPSKQMQPHVVMRPRQNLIAGVVSLLIITSFSFRVISSYIIPKICPASDQILLLI